MLILYILLGLVGLAVLLVLLLWINAIWGSVRANVRIEAMVRPALDAVQADDPAANNLIQDLAQNPATRNKLFVGLKELGRESLFPPRFRSLEMIAESDLVAWLVHPNELKGIPSAIELVRDFSVTDGEQEGRTFLFKFRIDPPHWAADDGWMAGVAGPYFPSDINDAEPAAAMSFSELTPIDKMSEQEHLAHLNKAMRMPGWVVPS
jgi:hypothetical protein